MKDNELTAAVWIGITLSTVICWLWAIALVLKACNVPPL